MASSCDLSILMAWQGWISRIREPSDSSLANIIWGTSKKCLTSTPWIWILLIWYWLATDSFIGCSDGSIGQRYLPLSHKLIQNTTFGYPGICYHQCFIWSFGLPWFQSCYVIYKGLLKTEMSKVVGRVIDFYSDLSGCFRSVMNRPCFTLSVLTRSRVWFKELDSISWLPCSWSDRRVKCQVGVPPLFLKI